MLNAIFVLIILPLLVIGTSVAICFFSAKNGGAGR